tara:strand:- start:113509 stop:113928 length:420 start_codon:yes stop_codon:yes gene_type:complete
MLLVTAVAILATMALALARAILGPSVYDRVLAVNMFGTKTVLLLAVMAFAVGRTDFLDLALAYALINFIGVLAVLWFVKDNQQHQQQHQQRRRARRDATASAAGDPAPTGPSHPPAVQQDHLPAVAEGGSSVSKDADKS